MESIKELVFMELTKNPKLTTKELKQLFPDCLTRTLQNYRSNFKHPKTRKKPKPKQQKCLWCGTMQTCSFCCEDHKNKYVSIERRLKKIYSFRYTEMNHELQRLKQLGCKYQFTPEFDFYNRFYRLD